jgi:23S rRNA (uracil1939-C5)-methyltransferase
MSETDRMELHIDGISHEGAGVARYEGQVVFVDGALPGELVIAKVTERAKSFIRAEVSEILTSSPYRVQPFCPHYGVCGGCSLQHADYEAGLSIKRQVVENALRRIGKFDDAEVRPVIGMKDPLHYRNKAEFRIEQSEGGIIAGFRMRSSHACVNLRECSIVQKESFEVVSALREELNRLEGLGSAGIRHAVIRAGAAGKMMLALVSTAPPAPTHIKLANALSERFPDLVSVYHSLNQRDAGEVMGRRNTLLNGVPKLECIVGGFSHMLSPTSFLQVNSLQADRLYSEAISLASLQGTENVLDVYCGIGTITLMLAKSASKALGIEYNPEAVRDAEANTARNGINNASFMIGKAEFLIGSKRAKGFAPEVAFLDPPRAGCEPAVLSGISALGVDRIVYVSCDPATLARDAGKLAQMGYIVKIVQPVDMFPFTSHIETVCLLTRK